MWWSLSAEAWLWVKAVHIIAVIAWMAGLLYLPRLFVYHSAVKPGSEASETFKIMERRLLRAIMHPAMVVSVVLGVVLLGNLLDFSQGWIHLKLTAVVGLLALHWAMARWRAAFAEDRNRHSEKFFRIMNEGPTVLMIAIVIAAVVKPF